MANGEWNCAALICCPPASRAAIAATAKILKAAGCDPDAADKCAPYIQSEFDLAKKGTLQPLKDWVAQEARANDFKE